MPVDCPQQTVRFLDDIPNALFVTVGWPAFFLARTSIGAEMPRLYFELFAPRQEITPLSASTPPDLENETHNEIAQPASLSGYFVRLERIGAEEQPEARTVCDMFVIEDGNPLILEHLKKHQGGGNTSNGFWEEKDFIVGIDLETLSENARSAIESSPPGHAVNLSVSLKPHVGKGASPCYSPLVIHDASALPSISYPEEIWKTYRNEDLGITVRYPPNLYVREYATYNSIYFSPLHPRDIRHASSMGLALGFTIRYRADKSMEDVLGEINYIDKPEESIRNVTIGGKSGIEVRSIGAYGGELHVVTFSPHREGVLEISYIEGVNLEHPRMVETISF